MQGSVGPVGRLLRVGGASGGARRATTADTAAAQRSILAREHGSRGNGRGRGEPQWRSRRRCGGWPRQQGVDYPLPCLPIGVGVHMEGVAAESESVLPTPYNFALCVHLITRTAKS